MSSANLNAAKFVERQMRNWELSKQHHAPPAVAEASQAVQFYIAISRELGSPGEEVAQCLSAGLGWPKYDREILDYMSEHEEVRRRLYEMLDECQRTWLQQLIEPIERFGIEAPAIRDEFFHRLSRSILAIAQNQHAIFVGRGANFVLPASRGVSVRIVAPLKDRIRWVMQTEGLSERAADRRIAEVENQRAHFLIKHFGPRPYDPRRYDLVINGATLAVPDICYLIRAAVERKSGQTAM